MKWQDSGVEMVTGSKEARRFFVFFVFVSINVRVLKCVLDRRGGQATGRAPFKRE